MFRSPPQPMWDLTIHPLWGPASSLALIPFSNQRGTPTKSTPLQGPVSLLAYRLVPTPFQGLASSLAHRPVSSSDTICNGPSPPLSDIIFFGLFLKVFKRRLLERGFHTFTKGVSFSSPTDVGSYSKGTKIAPWIKISTSAAPNE